MSINTQAILSAVTCAQLSDMMEEVEAMQSLIISQYEAIAMNEQQEITLLEEHMNQSTELQQQEVELDEILYTARYACEMIVDMLKAKEYTKADLRQEFKLLQTFIEEVRKYHHINQAVVAAVTYMKSLQVTLSNSYKGM